MAFCFDHWELDDGMDKAVTKLGIRNQKKLAPTSSNSSSSNSSNSTTVLRRKVSYASTCKVILVPAKEEYAAAGIDLWHDCIQQRTALSEVSEEVKKLMNNCPALNTPLAMAYLFQPNMGHSCPIRALLAGRSAQCGTGVNNIGEPLFIAVVDRNCSSDQLFIDRIYRSLTAINYWKISFNCIHSVAHLSSILSMSSKWKQQKQKFLDAVIIDESIFLSDPCLQHSMVQMEEGGGEEKGISAIGTSSLLGRYFEHGVLNRLLLLCRAALGSSVLLGLRISSCTSYAAVIREEALNSGSVDFIWDREDNNATLMLPLLLSARGERRR